MLSGKEYFYAEWLELVTAVVQQGPVLDLGTPRPFQKEMAPLRTRSATPVFCADYVPSPGVDLVADAHALPFAAGSVGGVLCSHVLEHVRDPRHVVSEVHRVLKPGGLAYFTLLDFWPYHAKPGVYADYHRFKRDAVELLFEGWTAVRTLQGGGVGHIVLNYVPRIARRPGRLLANLVDRRVRSTMTPLLYVAAQA
ncbi:MAG: hypothetical protein QOH36_75 [Actinomycetota bacterium]|nr:hypothetical protein [Actinomycetota bacterium]